MTDRCSIIPVIVFTGAVLFMFLTPLSIGQENNSGTKSQKSVLIVYHGGSISGQPAPPIEETDVDVLTHATAKDMNVKIVAGRIQKQLQTRGYQVDLKEATDVRGPGEFLDYGGIIFGTPTWFSNVAYPIKKIFDEHLIRIYAHRKGRLNDKALAGYTTAMDSKSGQQCLQVMTWGIEHLSSNVVEGMAINTRDDTQTVQAAINQFCERYSQALKK